MESMKRYPRDLLGYGRHAPDPKWPRGAKVAMQLVLNFEEGGERCLLHGDRESEAFLSEIIGAAPWPDQRHANMESMYEYGARAGFWRLHRILQGLPVTVFGVTTALARAPEAVAAMCAEDWEIACHGLKWIDYRNHTIEAERAEMRAAIALHAQVVGTPPRGWYTGRSSENTLRLVAEENNFDYAADSYADDLPYWQEFSGKNQLIVPYTLDANDMRFATSQGFNTGDQFETYLKDTLDCLLEEGRRGNPKMMSVGLHCRLAGRPGRALALKRFLDYAQTTGEVWFATRLQIADHWRKTHPPKPEQRPSTLSRAEFIKEFGGIFENSPWIAERAHRLELGPAHNSAQGLSNALARAFRAASPSQKLEVLRAHPDLAGKLAAAGRLTADSTAEQASAGLDMLSDKERAQFTALNQTYVEKFGFPFIIAVRDYDKAGILEAFQRRIKNPRDVEFAQACQQVERIATLRLIAKLEE